jgi:hypothetical protein
MAWILSRLTFGLWFVALIFALVASKKLLIEEEYDAEEIYEPTFLNFSPQFLDITMLGHRALYHDILEVWAIHYLLDPERISDPEVSTKIVSLIKKHKPRQEGLYMLACFILIDQKRADQCQDLTLVGLEIFPDSWRLPMMQGFVHIKVFNQPFQAAKFYYTASTRKNAPAYVERLAKKLIDQGELGSEDYENSMKLMLGNALDRKFETIVEQERQDD